MKNHTYHDYQISFPEDWTDRSTVLWISPKRFETTPTLKKSALPRENFVVERQLRKENEKEPSVYLESKLNELRPNLQGFQFEKPVGKVEGLDSAEATYTFSVDQMPIQQTHRVVFHGDWAFHLVATATKSRFPEISEQFEEVFSSFKPE